MSSWINYPKSTCSHWIESRPPVQLIPVPHHNSRQQGRWRKLCHLFIFKIGASLSRKIIFKLVYSGSSNRKKIVRVNDRSNGYVLIRQFDTARAVAINHRKNNVWTLKETTKTKVDAVLEDNLTPTHRIHAAHYSILNQNSCKAFHLPDWWIQQNLNFQQSYLNAKSIYPNNMWGIK